MSEDVRWLPGNVVAGLVVAVLTIDRPALDRLLAGEPPADAAPGERS